MPELPLEAKPRERDRPLRWDLDRADAGLHLSPASIEEKAAPGACISLPNDCAGVPWAKPRAARIDPSEIANPNDLRPTIWNGKSA